MALHRFHTGGSSVFRIQTLLRPPLPEAGRENALGLELADHFLGFRLDIGRFGQPLQFAIQLGESFSLG